MGISELDGDIRTWWGYLSISPGSWWATKRSPTAVHGSDDGDVLVWWKNDFPQPNIWWSKESRKPCSQCTWIFWGCAQLSDVQIGSKSGSSSVSYWKGWHRHRFFCTCSASQTERRWKISVISMWSQCHSFLPELVGKSTGNHRRPLCVGGKIEKPWFPANFPQKTSHWMWTASISHQSLIDCILRLKVASFLPISRSQLGTCKHNSYETSRSPSVGNSTN